MSMGHRNLAAGVVLLAVGFGYGLATGQLPERTLPGTPGPAFFPWLIAFALIGLSAALTVTGLIAVRGRDAGRVQDATRSVDATSGRDPVRGRNAGQRQSSVRGRNADRSLDADLGQDAARGRGEDSSGYRLPRQGWLALGGFAVYLLLLPWAGFVLASVPFSGALAALYGERRPIVVVAAAVVIPLVLFVVFSMGFQVLLPRGAW